MTSYPDWRVVLVEGPTVFEHQLQIGSKVFWSVVTEIIVSLNLFSKLTILSRLYYEL